MDARAADASFDYDAPSVRVVAGDADLRCAAEAAVAAVGARALTGDASDLSGADLLLVELSDDADEPLLDSLGAFVADRSRMIVTFPASMLDLVSARIDGAQLLCDPGAADRAAALAIALAPRRSGVAEPGPDESEKLRRLSDEVGRVARALAELADGDPPRRSLGDPGRSYRGEEPAPVTVEEVRRVIRLRRLREQFFDPALFGDPAWDILLDLFAARVTRQRVAVSSLCIAAAVPTTTALRWIRAMTDEGLLVRTADPHDARRVFIGLSDAAAQAMARYFAAARAIG